MNIISHIILRHLFISKHQIYSSKTKRCLKQFNRSFTVMKESKYEIYYLKSRSLVQVQGRDTTNFLQGLITSDVSKLNEKNISQYSMMLNVQGRVLYDLILYLLPTNQNKESGQTTILIECDNRIKDEFIQTMNKYKIRKKVTISDVSDTVKVFSSQNYNNTGIDHDDKIKLVTQDPRIPDLGHRILATGDFHTGDDIKYKECRYKLGIGEGIEDLPPGNSFPLESNVVFLNGVSLDKGCYLGQELTARTYYTGVTRKRLMPLLFHSEIVNVSHGSTILSEKQKSVGKFRQAVNQYGLGLMRVAEAKGKLQVTDNNSEKLVCTTKIPSWWPTGENHEL